MKLICAGLSKTATKSLAKALRILGFVVFDHLEHREFHFNEWIDLYCKGNLPDFVTMYSDVDVVIGLPVSFWFEEIYEAFPGAKVVLTIRDSEDVWVKSWAKEVESTRRSIAFRGRFALHWLLSIFTRPSVHQRHLPFIYPLAIAAFGSMNAKSTLLAKKKYREHNQRVQAMVPKEKLLIYNARQGWKPLCDFVGCCVPDLEFPRENVRSSLTNKANSVRPEQGNRNVFFFVASLVGLLSMLYCVYLHEGSFCNNKS